MITEKLGVPTGTKWAFGPKFCARSPFFFFFNLFLKECNKIIKSISFDLLIRKMQVIYQIVQKNVIYLFITNSLMFQIIF